MTLVEVVISMAITGMAVGGIISGYAYSTAAAEKSALILAANARAVERIEETRSAKWDTSVYPVIDELVSANFTNKVVNLDLSGSGKAVTAATIRTDISTISVTPPLRRIRVDCVWQFRGRTITNSIETCRAPDQ
jgi:type II secretory pathway pseudopilin PulG